MCSAASRGEHIITGGAPCAKEIESNPQACGHRPHHRDESCDFERLRQFLQLLAVSVTDQHRWRQALKAVGNQHVVVAAATQTKFSMQHSFTTIVSTLQSNMQLLSAVLNTCDC